jgi:hypothetical protein
VVNLDLEKVQKNVEIPTSYVIHQIAHKELKITASRRLETMLEVINLVETVSLY